MKNFFLLFFLCCSFLITAQEPDLLYDDWCIFEDDVTNNLNDEDYVPPSPEEAFVFNVAFWQINDKNGFYPEPITENAVLNVIAQMNMQFNDFGIFFKFNGLDEFDSPDDVVYRQWLDSDGDGTFGCETIPGEDPDGYMGLSRCQISAMRNYAFSQGFVKEQSFNIYIPANTLDYAGSANTSLGVMTYNRHGVAGPNMVHEFGHVFSLAHTFGPNSTDWRSDDPSRCEHVTRDINHPDFNAYDKGDGFRDTAAVPDFNREYCHFNSLPNGECNSAPYRLFYLDEDTCTYQGDNKDCAGRDYEISSLDVRNFMAYTYSSCRNTFTDEQIEQMRTRAASSWGDNFNTPLESLYEPYRGEYFVAGPIDPLIHTPYFQPGFTYFFQRCDGQYPQPADYYDTSFTTTVENLKVIWPDEQNYRAIYHPNHSAIHIKEVSQTTQDFRRRKCYNNYNRAAIGGKVTRFRDNVINTNIEINDQDAEQINDPNLENNLSTGLYKIEKDYEDGEKTETIIYKGNN